VLQLTRNKKIRQAVSIILTHKDELFYIKRQNFLNAFPGYTAFSGGKVDEQDLGDSLSETLINTVIREPKEELGHDLNHNRHKIKEIGKATSPSYNPLRFETYFFSIELDKKIQFTVDENEAVEYGWIKPQAIIDEYNKSQRLLVGPVKKIFESFASNMDGINYVDFDKLPQMSVPTIENIKNLIQVMPLSNTIFPATRTNSFVIGDEVKILLDPSPKKPEELKHYITKVKTYKIGKIFLTHHHPDHHEYAPEVALALNIPIQLSKDSHDRILDKCGFDYFKGFEVSFVKENDIVTKWLGEDVLAYAIPGHDEGHFGLAPSSLNWFIVGDLFQGVGTVVVGGDEGNMAKYLASLQKVIKLNPMCVIPSHGIPLGGTNILQKTYDHRLLREKQVLDLTQKGNSIEDILKLIYIDIPEGVLKYARVNIQSHLDKLKNENKI